MPKRVLPLFDDRAEAAKNQKGLFGITAMYQAG